jgi:hypothetical protein
MNNFAMLAPLMADTTAEISHSQYATRRKELLLLVKQLRSIGCDSLPRPFHLDFQLCSFSISAVLKPTLISLV